MATPPTGLRLKEKRRAKGMTQAALARTVGISASYLNLIENGRRPIGGRLLKALAGALETRLDELQGADDHQTLAALQEAAADPAVRAGGAAPEDSGAFLGHFPGWAKAMTTLHRAYAERDRLAAALADRLSQDPFIGESLHEILSNTAAIRSAIEILQGFADLSPEERGRFEQVLQHESGRLTESVRGLVGFLESAGTATSGMTPAEEVDEFFATQQNYFADIEDAVSALRFAARLEDGRMKSGLIDHLAEAHGVTVSRARDRAAYDPERRILTLSDQDPEPTRRFQLARRAAELAASDAIEEALTAHDSKLTSEASRNRARRALGNYAAGAMLAPYDLFIETAETVRYDLDAVRRRFALSYEQVAHRMATLRRPGAEGVPFAYLRVDPSGFAAKRLPAPNLPLPRRGGACPLWAIYRAFQTPGETAAQLAEFPSGARFLMVARAIEKTGGGPPGAPRRRYAIMLACEAIRAEELVYSDGMALDHRARPEPVGPSCRLCPRAKCPARQEEILIAP